MLTLASAIGLLAQLVERLNGIEEVSGSNPLGSTTYVPSAEGIEAWRAGNRAIGLVGGGVGWLGVMIFFSGLSMAGGGGKDGRV